MLYFQDTSIIIINFLIPFLIGSLIFFSAVIAPTIFLILDQQNARRFIRSIFPKLYMWSFFISLAVAFLCLLNNKFYSMIMFFISFGFLFSRQYLVKWINAVSDIKIKNKKQKKRFKILHGLSVIILISQITGLLILNLYI